MSEQAVVPAATSGTTSSTLAGMKASTLAFVGAHPVGVAIAGGVLLGVGSYYLGKFVANRANRKKADAPSAEAAAA